MSTLIIYVTHIYNSNVKFFLEHARPTTIPNADFILVLNGLTRADIPLAIPSEFEVVERPNVGHDFGGWAHALLDNDRHVRYAKFILINSTVCGPFLPLWCKDRNWVTLFTDLITQEIVLAGATIGVHNNQPHVQSPILVTDRRGLDIGIHRGIFNYPVTPITRDQAIFEKEIRYSTLVLEAGYNIGCLLLAWQGADFRRRYTRPNVNVFSRDNYFGLTVHPFEVIFIKCPDYHRLMACYSRWTDGEHEWRQFIKV